MNNVTKYQLKEISYSIIFFLIILLGNILFSDVEDFPLTRIIVGFVFFSLCVLLYEMYLGKKLQKVLRTPIYLLVSIIYYVIIFFIMLVSLLYVNLIFKSHYTLQEALSVNILELIPENVHSMLFYLFIFLTIDFLVQELKSRTLLGTVKNYLWSNPNQPIKDTRIFMFMDLISSTSYAEILGYSKYSNFIKDIYKELDEFVLETKGSIYQYVGDEVVVVWPLDEGLQSYNCIRFLFLFEKRMSELRKEFISKYGIFPKFKAGFHYGEVAIAEIGGLLRKDIAFHGDAVNTTARICSKCSELDERMLLSRDLVTKLASVNTGIEFESIGIFKLKGKKLETELLKVNKFAFGMKELGIAV